MHSDIWGPSPYPSHQNFRYFITFIDDYTRFTWLFPLHSKSEAFQTFHHFHTMVQTQFNLPIKALRSDHGGEYTSTVFSTYLLQHGILHQYSCPHTPEQNGVAERKNRHLLETARTLIHHASLTPPFWLEAASTAAHLINRLPTKTLNMTSPYQKLYHQPPPYHYLKTFGCLCYPWTAYTRTNKLEPKSSPCIFLGYSPDHLGFRCFDPLTSKLFLSRHVRFHEHEFPMSKNPTLHTNPQISTIHNPLPPLPTPTYYPPPTPHPTSPSRPNPPPLLPTPTYYPPPTPHPTSLSRSNPPYSLPPLNTHLPHITPPPPLGQTPHPHQNNTTTPPPFSTTTATDHHLPPTTPSLEHLYFPHLHQPYPNQPGPHLQ